MAVDQIDDGKTREITNTISSSARRVSWRSWTSSLRTYVITRPNMKTVLLLPAPQPPLKGYFFPLIFGSALLSVIVLFHSYFSTGHVKRIKALYLILVVYFLKCVLVPTCSQPGMHGPAALWAILEKLRLIKSRCLRGICAKVFHDESTGQDTAYLHESFWRREHLPPRSFISGRLTPFSSLPDLTKSSFKYVPQPTRMMITTWSISMNN